LIDLGVEPFLLPSSLRVVLAQRLVRVLCPDCKVKVKAKAEVKELILKEIESLPEVIKKTIQVPSPLYVYEPKGCKKCNLEGYSERMGIFEVFSMTDQLADLLVRKFSEGELEQEAHRQGRITMKQDGMLKVLEGMISVEEVIRVTGEE